MATPPNREMPGAPSRATANPGATNPCPTNPRPTHPGAAPHAPAASPPPHPRARRPAAPATTLAAAFAALALALTPRAADSRPDEAGWIESRQVVDLFSDACLHFAAPDALRAWLAGQGYRRMPPDQEQVLLRSPGRGYDASTRTGHQALLSLDDGWCIAVAEDVDPGRLVALLEQRLRLAGADFRPVGDETPPSRRYTVQRGSHQSLLVVMVTPLDDRQQGSLLLAPMD